MKGSPHQQLLPLAKGAGFDGIFSSWRFADDREAMMELKALADRLGLVYENAHSTIPGTALAWSPVPEAEDYAETVLRELKACGYPGSVTLEVNYNRYKDKLTPEEFVHRCYRCADEIRKYLDA